MSMDQKKMYRELAISHGFNEAFIKRVLEEADRIMQEDSSKPFFFRKLYALKTAHKKVETEWKGMILEGMVLD